MIAKKLKPCSVEGCKGRFEGRGLCIKHYLRLKRYGDINFTKIEKHGMTDTVEYQTWCNIKRRCYAPSNNRYHLYGGRGITVCDRWRNSFIAFYGDMGKRPEGHSIDRINNDGNYEPGNCRWATYSQQTFNTRQRPSKSGTKGVEQLSKNSYRARIRANGATIELGIFDTLEKATEARQKADLLYFT